MKTLLLLQKTSVSLEILAELLSYLQSLDKTLSEHSISCRKNSELAEFVKAAEARHLCYIDTFLVSFGCHGNNKSLHEIEIVEQL